jgi:hypothetical protein
MRPASSIGLSELPGPVRVVAAALLALVLGSPASAGDVTAFIGQPSPTDVWGRGYGATLSSTWFQAISFEGEAARMRGDATDASMTSFTGSALLAPPIGLVTPYGGLGIGLFRQSLGTRSDTGVVRALVLGLKVKLGSLLLVKGEYRSLHLSGEPLLPMTRRVSLGAGISF